MLLTITLDNLPELLLEANWLDLEAIPTRDQSWGLWTPDGEMGLLWNPGSGEIGQAMC
jgi:hypothetical protein